MACGGTIDSSDEGFYPKVLNWGESCWTVVTVRNKAWIVSGLAVLVLVGLLLGWKALWRPAGQDSLAMLDESWQLREKEKTIRALEGDVARLTRELEQKTQEIAELRARLGGPAAAKRPEEPGPRSAKPEKPRLADRVPPAEKPSQTIRLYTITRDTSVFEEPSNFSRKLLTVPKGTTVTVVGSSGGWLEIRSKHGRPPGFVRRDDAVPAGSGN